MCKLFIEADARLWQTRLKSVRLHGFSTSVRLEEFYWRVLEELAGRDGLTLSQLLAKLHEELTFAHGEVENFASFLRVCCGRYLALQLAGEVPRDLGTPIAALDAEAILAREAARSRSGQEGRVAKGRGDPHMAEAGATAS
ncbi:ribbon-helix-helix domain-containing protein [Ancylobacter sp. 6x-1]|uniref:Ribbon-helix-helix domain-containing protein n=1 Tax=Ancylobacter crimeensis TaxID=2579147 RepID=A0ABT0DGQ2_9HYPH|nr:ribbon-helix-helix domain-containing protein [Ancylobacter crimeensis]MCK0199059.1 ribbon-helix-helix domain-containing protein [Ancylobacter crimeensis]